MFHLEWAGGQCCTNISCYDLLSFCTSQIHTFSGWSPLPQMIVYSVKPLTKLSNSFYTHSSGHVYFSWLKYPPKWHYCFQFLGFVVQSVNENQMIFTKILLSDVDVTNNCLLFELFVKTNFNLEAFGPCQFTSGLFNIIISPNQLNQRPLWLKLQGWSKFLWWYLWPPWPWKVDQSQALFIALYDQ